MVANAIPEDSHGLHLVPLARQSNLLLQVWEKAHTGSDINCAHLRFQYHVGRLVFIVPKLSPDSPALKGEGIEDSALDLPPPP